jgi:hypothetical protein
MGNLDRYTLLLVIVVALLLLSTRFLLPRK